MIHQFKKNMYLLLLLAIQSTQLAAQTPDFSIYGYAAMEGSTTGGAGGPVVAPTTFEQLQQYASGTNPCIILIDREFKGPNVLRMGSNKTLFGVDTKGFINQIGISIQSQHNIIIRNIRFTMTGVPITNDGENKVLGFNFDPDCISIQADDETLPEAQRKSSHIWIDHCEFYNEDPTVMTDYDRYDGLVDVKNDCQYITISWNYFHDHHKACLSGKGNSDDFDRKTTMHHNKFQNIGSRIPLLRFGKLHMLNNYIVDCAEGNGLNVRINSNAYVEKNYFDNIKKPIFGKLSEGGKAFLKENVFKDCNRLPAGYLTADSPGATALSSSEEFESTTYVPPYLYSAISIPVNDVPTTVTKYSGIGKLKAPTVTILTSIADSDESSSAHLYPNPTNGPVHLSTNTAWALTNTLGETISRGHSDQVDLSAYQSGIYFLKFGNRVHKIEKQ
jgi:pectate lyase